MRVRLPSQPQRYQCHTHTLLSIHSNTHFSHILNKTKNAGLQWDNGRKAGHHGNKLRGTGAGCVCVCGTGGDGV